MASSRKAMFELVSGRDLEPVELIQQIVRIFRDEIDQPILEGFLSRGRLGVVDHCIGEVEGLCSSRCD